MRRTRHLLLTAALSITAMVAAVPAVAATPITQPGPHGGPPGATQQLEWDPSGTLTMGSAQVPGAETQASQHATGSANGNGPHATSLTAAGGNAFDTCINPSVSDMRAWLASPYRSIGVYIGGVAYAHNCKLKSTLNAGWVSSVTGMGWNMLPIYVGLQAPCTRFKDVMSTNQDTAAHQGQQAALDAMNKMRGLGLDPRTPVYFDMENYNHTLATCSIAVHAFTDAWTRTLHAHGYLSGIYGSAGSMIHHLQAWTGKGGYAAPDNVWIARWNGDASAHETVLPNDAWAGHRIHQFAGGHDETWGGVTIHIDSDFVQHVTTTPSHVTAMTPHTIWDSHRAIVGTRPTALAVGGVAGVPRDASAVMLSISVVRPTADGSLIVTPYKDNSNITTQQFSRGQYLSTTVLVPTSSRDIQFRVTNGKARIIVKAIGYVSPSSGQAFNAVYPRVLWDSHSRSITAHTTALKVAGVGQVPRDATAALLHVQVSQPSSTGSLIIGPYQGNVRTQLQYFAAGDSTSATVLVPLNKGDVQFHLSSGKARVVVSALGYLSPTATGKLTATSPSLLWDSGTSTIGLRPTALAVAGVGGVPTDATAVALNVEVMNPSATGTLLVEPYRDRTNVRAAYLKRGHSTSATVIVPIRDGDVQFRLSAGRARIMVTSVGYITK